MNSGSGSFVHQSPDTITPKSSNTDTTTGSSSRGSDLHRHPSEFNLLQDEPRMEGPLSSHYPASANQHQSAGLSSSPDDDTTAKSATSAGTTPTSNLLGHRPVAVARASITTGSFYSDHDDDSDDEPRLHVHIHEHETHVPEHELEDIIDWKELSNSSAGGSDVSVNGDEKEEKDESDPNLDVYQYLVDHANEVSDSDEGDVSSLQDELKRARESFQNEVDNTDDNNQQKGKSAAMVWASEDDLDERDPAEGTAATLEFENVEYNKCMGRLVLSSEALEFYRWGESKLKLDWEQIAKRQVSPPSYSIPMLRVKTLALQNYMFHLPNVETANQLREELLNYPKANVSNMLKSDSIESSTGSTFFEQAQNTPRQSVADKSSPPLAVIPMEQDTMVMQDESFTNNSSYVDRSEDYHGDELQEESERFLRDTNTGSSNYYSASSWQDGQDDQEEESYDDEEDADDDDSDVESAREKAARDAEQRLAQEKAREEQGRRFCYMIFLTFCCTAILFVAAGLVGGYFWGKSVNSSSSNQSAAADNNTPMPVVAPGPTGPTAAPSQSNSTLGWYQPSSPVPTTFAPSEYPTFGPNHTGAPTKRGIPPPERPTAEEPDGNATTLSPTVADAFIPNSNTLTPSVVASTLSTPTVTITLSPTIANETLTIRPTTQEILTTTLPPTSAVTNDTTAIDSTTDAPTANTPLLETLRALSSDNGAAIDTIGSPQNLAYQWSAVGDVYGLANDLSESKQVQRYALATFYFATGGDEVWIDDTAARQERPVSGTWLNTGYDDCEWDYIVCNEDQEVIALELLSGEAPALKGSIPPELGLLTALTQFVIATGDETEATAARQNKQAIAAGLGIWEYNDKQADVANATQTPSVTVNPLGEENVTTTAVNGEMLSGPLPSELGNLLVLETLQITNQALSGAIPEQVENMTSLVVFDVTNNQLNGLVPPQFGSLPRLRELRLGANSFQGKLRKGFFTKDGGMSQSLQALLLNDNQILGDIPTEMGLLKGITTGLFLGGNRLTGTLPTELGELKEIIAFRVEFNKLDGTIPMEFSNWIKLEDFRVHGNGFTGEIPEGLCRTFLVQDAVSYAECEYLNCTCCQFCCSNGVCEEVS